MTPAKAVQIGNLAGIEWKMSLFSEQRKSLLRWEEPNGTKSMSIKIELIKVIE